MTQSIQSGYHPILYDPKSQLLKLHIYNIFTYLIPWVLVGKIKNHTSKCGFKNLNNSKNLPCYTLYPRISLAILSLFDSSSVVK